jgi:hypothetical protein
MAAGTPPSPVYHALNLFQSLSPRLSLWRLYRRRHRVALAVALVRIEDDLYQPSPYHFFYPALYLLPYLSHHLCRLFSHLCRPSAHHVHPFVRLGLDHDHVRPDDDNPYDLSPCNHSILICTTK